VLIEPSTSVPVLGALLSRLCLGISHGLCELTAALPCGLSGTGNANISPLLPNVSWLCRVTSQPDALPSQNSFDLAAHNSQFSAQEPRISQPLPPELAQKTRP